MQNDQPKPSSTSPSEKSASEPATPQSQSSEASESTSEEKVETSGQEAAEEHHRKMHQALFQTFVVERDRDHHSPELRPGIKAFLDPKGDSPNSRQKS